MKTLFLLAALATTQCFAQGDAGPSFSSMFNLCEAEGHKMGTFGKCLGSKLDQYRPGWRESGKGYEDAQWIVSFLETLGKRVKKKEISDAEAERLATTEMQAIGNRRLAQQQALASEQERQRIANLDNQRLQIERDRLEEERKNAEYSRMQAQIALDIAEKEAQQRKSMQLFDAGMRIMQNSRRYNPPPQMPITCTSDRWNGMVTTTCQ